VIPEIKAIFRFLYSSGEGKFLAPNNLEGLGVSNVMLTSSAGEMGLSIAASAAPSVFFSTTSDGVTGVENYNKPDRVRISRLSDAFDLVPGAWDDERIETGDTNHGSNRRA
jgi:hypothetical protein